MQHNLVEESDYWVRVQYKYCSGDDELHGLHGIIIVIRSATVDSDYWVRVQSTPFKKSNQYFGWVGSG